MLAFTRWVVGGPNDWRDQAELQFTYEHSTLGFKALPTFGVLYPSKMIELLVGGKTGNKEFNPMMLVQGEQYLEIKQRIPTSGTITSYAKIAHIYDKGSGMVMVTDTSCKHAAGNEVVFNQSSIFIRGMGRFGGERCPSGEIHSPPEREPDAAHLQQTLPQQALLYRLSNDSNPLHADRMMAAISGFDRPIVHGLCTFGFAGRAVLKYFCDNDPSRFSSIKMRFSKHVFPGETLITKMWKRSDTQVIFRTKVAERDEYVLTQAAVEIKPN